MEKRQLYEFIVGWDIIFTRGVHPNTVDLSLNERLSWERGHPVRPSARKACRCRGRGDGVLVKGDKQATPAQERTGCPRSQEGYHLFPLDFLSQQHWGSPSPNPSHQGRGMFFLPSSGGAGGGRLLKTPVPMQW